MSQKPYSTLGRRYITCAPYVWGRRVLRAAEGSLKQGDDIFMTLLTGPWHLVSKVVSKVILRVILL